MLLSVNVPKHNKSVTVVADDDDHRFLSKLLDETLVCPASPGTPSDPLRHRRDFEEFSQRTGFTAGSSSGPGRSSLSEVISYHGIVALSWQIMPQFRFADQKLQVVNFAIWKLFHRAYPNEHRPPHILCHGYQRVRGPRQNDDGLCAAGCIPGIVAHFPNGNVETLKSGVWSNMLGLLGKDGDAILLDMLLDCALFTKIESGRGNYSQLSGVSLPCGLETSPHPGHRQTYG